mmetsp:Transcript_43707/g.121005  ORF Transcript_43707/g.121005 Transcript_43707/m.121005 type:complete len:601 (+) Transcript_43707:1356-3158(+)
MEAEAATLQVREQPALRLWGRKGLFHRVLRVLEVPGANVQHNHDFQRPHEELCHLVLSRKLQAHAGNGIAETRQVHFAGRGRGVTEERLLEVPCAELPQSMTAAPDETRHVLGGDGHVADICDLGLHQLGTIGTSDRRIFFVGGLVKVLTRVFVFAALRARQLFRHPHENLAHDSLFLAALWSQAYLVKSCERLSVPEGPFILQAVRLKRLSGDLRVPQSALVFQPPALLSTALIFLILASALLLVLGNGRGHAFGARSTRVAQTLSETFEGNPFGKLLCTRRSHNRLLACTGVLGCQHRLLSREPLTLARGRVRWPRRDFRHVDCPGHTTPQSPRLLRQRLEPRAALRIGLRRSNMFLNLVLSVVAAPRFPLARDSARASQQASRPDPVQDQLAIDGLLLDIVGRTSAVLSAFGIRAGARSFPTPTPPRRATPPARGRRNLHRVRRRAPRPRRRRWHLGRHPPIDDRRRCAQPRIDGLMAVLAGVLRPRRSHGLSALLLARRVRNMRQGRRPALAARRPRKRRSSVRRNGPPRAQSRTARQHCLLDGGLAEDAPRAAAIGARRATTVAETFQGQLRRDVPPAHIIVDLAEVPDVSADRF